MNKTFTFVCLAFLALSLVVLASPEELNSAKFIRRDDETDGGDDGPEAKAAGAPAADASATPAPATPATTATATTTPAAKTPSNGGYKDDPKKSNAHVEFLDAKVALGMMAVVGAGLL